MCHFMPIVWKSHTKIGCGLNIKPGDGTYVTVHYGPSTEGVKDVFAIAPQNVLKRRALGKKIYMRNYCTFCCKYDTPLKELLMTKTDKNFVEISLFRTSVDLTFI